MHKEDYKGFSIEIDDDEKTLLVNGENIPFLKTDDGYSIYYQSPKDSLLESAKDYLQTQAGGDK